MRPVRPNGRPLVIELAGLPGAGKTSLTDRVRLPHLGRRDIGVVNLPLRRETWRVARAAMMLALTIRPWKPGYLLRAIKLVLALRSYGPLDHDLVIMDQGLVQKMWSFIIESRSYPEQRLEELVDALTPFAADHLVWIAVPHELAAQRIAGRTGGNSRFDGQDAATIAQRLADLERPYRTLVEMFRKKSGMSVLSLDGEANLKDNAARIEALASRR
jgi:adenylate kinase family enzyme